MNKTATRAGFWSVLIVLVCTVVFMAAFMIYIYVSTMKWEGMRAFAAAFKEGLYLAWVIPCLLLALAFPVFGASISFIAEDKGRFWAFISLIFSVMYGAILTTDYWLLLTVVRGSITGGNFTGLPWLVIGSPYSITNSIEGIGYCFMGLSFIFHGLSFTGSKLALWIRSLLLVNGIATALSVVVAVLGVMAVSWVAGHLGCYISHYHGFAGGGFQAAHGIDG